MMKKLVIVLILVVGAMVATWIIYNKPHREVSNETAIAVEANNLYESFQQNESKANLDYLNKVLQVTGKINSTSINAANQKVLILETTDPLFGINCTLTSDEQETEVGDKVTVIGICTGYLSDVVMVQCQLQNIIE